MRGGRGVRARWAGRALEPCGRPLPRACADRAGGDGTGTEQGAGKADLDSQGRQRSRFLRCIRDDVDVTTALPTLTRVRSPTISPPVPRPPPRAGPWPPPAPCEAAPTCACPPAPAAGAPGNGVHASARVAPWGKERGHRRPSRPPPRAASGAADRRSGGPPGPGREEGGGHSGIVGSGDGTAIRPMVCTKPPGRLRRMGTDHLVRSGELPHHAEYIRGIHCSEARPPLQSASLHSSDESGSSPDRGRGSTRTPFLRPGDAAEPEIDGPGGRRQTSGQA